MSGNKFAFFRLSIASSVVAFPFISLLAEISSEEATEEAPSLISLPVSEVMDVSVTEDPF